METKYSETRVTNRTITTEPFYKNLVRATDKVETCTNGVKTTTTKVIITTLENIESVVGLDEISERIPAPKMYQEYAKVCLIDREKYKALMRAEYHITEVVEDFDNEKYDADKYMAVLFNWGSHTVADLDGNFIPIPVHVDYIEANMSDEYYDLKKVLSKIAGDSCIVSPKKLEIKDIPSYNSTPWASKYLDFYFIPNVNVYEAAQTQGLGSVAYMIKHTFDIEDCKWTKDED